MIIDTSAVLAILQEEPESPRIREAIEDDPIRLMSAATYLEASMVVEARFGEPGGRELDLMLHVARVEVVSVDREQAEVAREGFRRFGKGRHRAGLNFGDCFSYALARVTGEPLLFKGGDFVYTDVEAVI
ncbi:MAG: type II toxin-antitoxin system VapC family toxin [Thermoanaerobaculales bacterium]|jgi:ribonuclease VapC|nr:type II toxin-antitoxin system VapC family toxin [Thermoanaerobaculales bacterium]